MGFVECWIWALCIYAVAMGDMGMLLWMWITLIKCRLLYWATAAKFMTKPEHKYGLTQFAEGNRITHIKVNKCNSFKLPIINMVTFQWKASIFLITIKHLHWSTWASEGHEMSSFSSGTRAYNDVSHPPPPHGNTPTLSSSPVCFSARQIWAVISPEPYVFTSWLRDEIHREQNYKPFLLRETYQRGTSLALKMRVLWMW